MKGNSNCSITYKNAMIDNASAVVVSLYMPLIGKNAAVLYLLMTAQKAKAILSLEYFCCLCHLSIDELDEALSHLEEFMLVKTYFNRHDESYLFELRSPLTGRDFFENDVYSRLYLNAVGKDRYALCKEQFDANPTFANEYEDISRSMSLKQMEGWTKADEKTYQQVNACSHLDNIKIRFDKEKFLKQMSVIVFPHSFRSEDNLNKIGALATLYCVEMQDMLKYVGQCTSLSENRIDFEMLEKKCIGCKTTHVNDDEDPYDEEPVAFLYKKQGVAVANADKRLLSYLQCELKMDIGVINVLIEHVLNTTGNKFNKDYVEKIATTWIRQSIKTKDEALKQISCQPVSTTKVKFSVDEMKVDDADIDELRKKLFARG